MRLSAVEDNAPNRRVAAELLSSEGARVALADGGLAGVQQVLEARAVRRGADGHADADIDGLEATRRIRADALRRAADPCHDRQRLAGRPRSRPRRRA